ncbi:MAG TPA: DMT family transporter [Solirubrobacterales bacterium]|nr:DMT family transporter [Solirubrobacterales bacterium]
MDIVLALVAALLFALGTVLQQRAGLEKPVEGASSGLLIQMAKRPVWLLGILADAFGFIAQAAALGIGRLAVVQPLLVASVVFALPLGARLTGQRIRRVDVGAAFLVVAALVAFLTIANPSGGRDDAPLDEWLVAIGACIAICVPLTLLGRSGPAPRRAACLGIATGVLFALSAALTKVVVDELDEGVFEIFLSWHLYALVAIGYASMTFNQLALNTGALAPAVATSMAFDPITSVVLGVTLLNESLHTTPFDLIGTVAALAAALVGMALLARSQSQAEPVAA